MNTDIQSALVKLSAARQISAFSASSRVNRRTLQRIAKGLTPRASIAMLVTLELKKPKWRAILEKQA